MLPRARFLGEPEYATDEADAKQAMIRMGAAIRDRILVEDPDRPLAATAKAVGSVKIVRDDPERVEIDVSAETPGYLFLADSYDPGWSATLDGKNVPVRPAAIAFRAVFVPSGQHGVSFSYRPAGFLLGLTISCIGLGLAVLGFFSGRMTVVPDSPHLALDWPGWWPWAALAAILLIVLVSIPIRVTVPSTKRPRQAESISRWRDSFHRFTWGAGIEAIRPPKPPLE